MNLTSKVFLFIAYITISDWQGVDKLILVREILGVSMRLAMNFENWPFGEGRLA